MQIFKLDDKDLKLTVKNIQRDLPTWKKMIVMGEKMGISGDVKTIKKVKIQKQKL